MVMIIIAAGIIVFMHVCLNGANLAFSS